MATAETLGEFSVPSAVTVAASPFYRCQEGAGRTVRESPKAVWASLRGPTSPKIRRGNSPGHEATLFSPMVIPRTNPLLLGRSAAQ